MRRTYLLGSGRIGAALVCTVLLGGSGCELLVDFDRSKIPQADSSVPYEASGPGPDGTASGSDAPQSSDQASGNNTDTGMAGKDGGSEASLDATGSVDGGNEAARSDSSTDSGGGSDVSTEASQDSAGGSPADGGSTADAPPDGSGDDSG